VCSIAILPQHHHNFKAGAMNALVHSLTFPMILSRKINMNFIVFISKYSFSSNINFYIGMQIWVSSAISSSPIIMNVDCDMYSNTSDTIRDALCFFLDEEMGHKI
jgi:hypothetical protein